MVFFLMVEWLGARAVSEYSGSRETFNRAVVEISLHALEGRDALLSILTP